MIRASTAKTQPQKSRQLYDYTQGSIGWAITRLSVPMCVEQVIRNLDGLLEIYWIGQLGPEYLAATSLGFMIIMFLRSIGFGIRIAGQALVAQRIGAVDGEGAATVAGQTIFFMLVYVVVFSVGGYMMTPYLMELMTEDPEIIRLGTIYMRAGFTAFIGIEAMFVMANILRGAGEPAYTLYSMMAGACVSIGAVPLFIFGGGPVPAMGIAGGFFGMGIGRMTGGLVMIAFIAAGRSRIKLRPGHLLPHRELLLRLVSLAWPVSMQNLLERGANVILLRLLSPFGANALAAWAVGNRITLVSRMPGFGLQSAVRTLVGQNMGAERPERAIRTVRVSLTVLAAIMGVVTLLLSYFAGRIVVQFGMTGEAAEVGAMALQILSVGLLMESLRRVAAGAFQGAARSKPPMVVEGAVRWGVQIPAAFLMAYPFGVGAASIWLAIAGSQILSGVALIVWFFSWTSGGGMEARKR